MATLEEISAFLVSQKPHLARLGIKKIGVFGSYVRGDQNSDSDLDILVDLERPAKIGLLEFIGIEQDISEHLGLPVDLVIKSNLRPLLRERILAEVVYL